MTTSPAEKTRDHLFLMGFTAGAVLGAGLGMLLAPRAAVEFRGRVAGSAKSLGNAAFERYQQASARVGAAARESRIRGQAIRDGLADTVVRGAQRVEQYATEAKTNLDARAPEHSAP